MQRNWNLLNIFVCKDLCETFESAVNTVNEIHFVYWGFKISKPIHDFGVFLSWKGCCMFKIITTCKIEPHFIKNAIHPMYHVPYKQGFVVFCLFCQQGPVHATLLKRDR